MTVCGTGAYCANALKSVPVVGLSSELYGVNCANGNNHPAKPKAGDRLYPLNVVRRRGCGDYGSDVYSKVVDS